MAEDQNRVEVLEKRVQYLEERRTFGQVESAKNVASEQSPSKLMEESDGGTIYGVRSHESLKGKSSSGKLNFTNALLSDPMFMAGDREFGKLTEWDWRVPALVPQQQKTRHRLLGLVSCPPSFQLPLGVGPLMREVQNVFLYGGGIEARLQNVEFTTTVFHLLEDVQEVRLIAALSKDHHSDLALLTYGALRVDHHSNDFLGFIENDSLDCPIFHEANQVVPNFPFEVLNLDWLHGEPQSCGLSC
ncbi:hypothetical protein COLO4_20913 [Corchorus olitorius]|uniref:Uncharacterized protein n=1 Tax=Corchorus olitorius TaxID=93759 RepID=A0A1R3IW47_9ROSI|nr:hypothetical protein COLO4_20913 [Corchorus olitorius]